MSEPVIKNEKEKLIIELDEVEQSVLTERNEIADMKVEGTLSIVNPSRECRIWNTELSLKSVDNTDLNEDTISVGEVQVNGKWSKRYNVTTDQPLLRLVETVDTCSALKSLEPHWAFSYGVATKVLFTIRLTNVSDTKITDIVVRKSFPTYFGKPTIDEPSTGKAVFHPKNREIVWDQFELYPNTDVDLVISAEIKPDSVKSYDGGQINATYHATDKTRSALAPKVKALTNALVGGTTEEDPRQPGKWACIADLLNDSSFPLFLHKVEITHVQEGKREKVVEEEPKVVLTPNESFSKEFIVESPGPPHVERNIDYSVITETQRRVTGFITKQSQVLPVIALEPDKVFLPGEIDAYDKTPLTAKLTVKNVGSAVLNEVSFIDILPVDFKPPKAADVKVLVNGQPLPEGVSITREPNDDDPTKEHRLTIVVSDLDPNIGGLHPNGVVECEYPVIAWGPKPRIEYLSPLEVTGNVNPQVYPARLSIPPVKIGIRYVSRRIAIYKTVQPGSTAGQFIIPLRFINRGGVAVENISITDFIPAGFTLESWEPADLKPEQSPLPDGILLTWTFPRIERGNQITINYTISGTGKYERREPQIVGS